jgi:hypothetical protein
MSFCRKCNNLYDISNKSGKETQSGGKEVENEIYAILNGGAKKSSMKYSELSKTKEFKEKSVEEKQRIQKELNVKKKEFDESLISYFVCKNCGFSEPIAEKTVLYKKILSSKSNMQDMDLNKYKNMIYDATLPHTRNYICPNKECETHNGTEKDAVFIRMKNSFRIVNVCCVCKTPWL